MAQLYTAKEVLKELTENKIVTFKKVAFSEAVTAGIIPHKKIDGVKKKMYDYDDVKVAIINAGIGNPPPPEETLEDLPEQKDGQSDEEYLIEIEKRFKKAPTLTDANIIKTIVGARHAQLKLDEDLGLLVKRSIVENKAFTVSRSIRDKILTIPERLANELATISDPHKVKELLYKEFGILLTGFSEESFL